MRMSTSPHPNPTSPVRVGDTLKATGKVTWAHATKPVCHMDVVVTATPDEKTGGETKDVLKGKVVVYRSQPKPQKSPKPSDVGDAAEQKSEKAEA